MGGIYSTVHGVEKEAHSAYQGCIFNSGVGNIKISIPLINPGDFL